MPAWTEGYVAEVGYTYGYYAELNPLRLQLAFLSQGLVFPEVGTACELGYGQGLSAAMHATASIVEWHGTDFNPSQAGFAKELISASGIDANLIDGSFDEFCQRENLPQFDYIGLHGIWSWINDENRKVIVDFVRNKLKVGGVLYISYNALPGWAAFVPMRHLMALHSEVMGADGQGISSRVDNALEFITKMMALNPGYVRANPQIAERIARIKDQPRPYLAHEYFNRDWEPMHFSDMARWLEPAKMQYACSANYLELVDVLQLTKEQQKFASEIEEWKLKEVVRDFLVNQQFRKDYWVKGVRQLNPIERMEKIRNQRVVLITEKSLIKMKVGGALGEAELSGGVYEPMIDLLSDHKPRTIGQLEKSLEGKGISFEQITQAVLILAGKGNLSSANEEAVVTKIKKQTHKMNVHLINKSRGTNEVGYLVSPVTGGGVALGQIDQLFLLAMGQGKGKIDELVEVAWSVLKMRGQKLVKENKTIEEDDENIAALQDYASDFILRVPMLKALMIIG